MVKELIGYVFDQNDDDKTVIVYKDDTPLFRISWTRKLNKTELKKYGPKILKKAENLVILSELYDLTKISNNMLPNQVLFKVLSDN